jgi:hypothetical protein
MLGAGIPPVSQHLPSVSNPDASAASHWPMLLLLAFAIGVVLGVWLGSRVSASPSDGRSGWGGGWGGPPPGSPEPPDPIGWEGEPSWIDEIERFLAEQTALPVDGASRGRVTTERVAFVGDSGRLAPVLANPTCYGGSRSLRAFQR